MPREELTTERLNRLRAEAARRALSAHRVGKAQRREPLQSRVVDLLTDLFHLARRRGLSPVELVRVAEGHYQTERSEEAAAKRAHGRGRRTGLPNRLRRRR